MEVDERQSKIVRAKIVLEGVKEYKEGIGIIRQETEASLKKVKELNMELEQLNKHIRSFVELREKLF